jgi:hypothetical protein
MWGTEGLSLQTRWQCRHSTNQVVIAPTKVGACQTRRRDPTRQISGTPAVDEAFIPRVSATTRPFGRREMFNETRIRVGIRARNGGGRRRLQWYSEPFVFPADVTIGDRARKQRPGQLQRSEFCRSVRRGSAGGTNRRPGAHKRWCRTGPGLRRRNTARPGAGWDQSDVTAVSAATTSHE